MTIQATVNKPRMRLTKVPKQYLGGKMISFGAAGVLYTGPDAEILQGCRAILNIYEDSVRGSITDYMHVVRRIEARAVIVAPISAVTPEAVRAKAEVVRTLAEIGMAGGAQRVLAASLARDVLAVVGGA